MTKASAFTQRAAAFTRGFVQDPFTHWPFPGISRKVYGNLSGFRQNLYGSIDTGLHRLLGVSHNNAPCDPSDRALAKELRKLGIAKVTGWIDPAVIETVRTRILDVAQTEGQSPSEYFTMLDAQTMARHAPEAFDIFNARIEGFLEAYFGGPFLVNSGAFRLTRHVPEALLEKGEVYSDHWHTDSGPSSMLAIFVLLNDIGPDGGPTSALDVPATKDMVREGYVSRKESRDMVQKIENHPAHTQMTGPAGTVMFVNVARCLHRAGIPAEGKHREWLQFRLFPCRDVTDTSRLQSARILKYTNRINQDY